MTGGAPCRTRYPLAARYALRALDAFARTEMALVLHDEHSVRRCAQRELYPAT